MPSWGEILQELNSSSTIYDTTRRKYVAELAELTGRNVIIYYSGWLQKKNSPGPIEINDEDKNAFMATIHKLDREKGLDLLLHTPGGDMAATESLIDYLRSMFDTDIRAIIPQIAMSGGTMIACACKEIIMGKHSSLGPIDPIRNGLPTHGIIEEFERASEEIKNDPSKIPIWQMILSKYPPSFIGECEKAAEWADDMTREWLTTGMFKDEKAPKKIINKIMKELGDHARSLSHSRHINLKKCQDMGLKVTPLEENPKLQEAVLSVHHSCMISFTSTNATKIVENHCGGAYINVLRSPMPPQPN